MQAGENTSQLQPVSSNEDVASTSQSTEISGGVFPECHIGSQDQHFTNTVENQTIHQSVHYHHTTISEQAALPEASASTRGVSQRHNTESGEEELGAGGKKRKKDQPDDYIKLPASLEMFLNQPLRPHGHIYQGRQKTAVGPRQIAIKSLKFDDNNRREAEILYKLAYHQNVVHIVHSDIYYQGDFKYIYIAMELCDQKNLYEYVKENGENNVFDAAQSIAHAKQLVEGLHHIHENDVLHRDLKPHNILFAADGKMLKIADFGLSKPLQNDRSKTRQTHVGAGTEGYMAPETLKGHEISKQTDIFSLGLLLFFLWSNGEHPFGDELDLWNYKIKKGELPCLDALLIGENMKEQAKTLLNKLLEFKPESRPTTAWILNNWIDDTSRPPSENLNQGEEAAVAVNEEGDEAESLLESEPDIKRQCIAMFDKGSQTLVACDIAHKKPGEKFVLKEVQGLISELVRQSYSAVVIGDTVYALSWRKFTYRCTPTSDTSGWWRLSYAVMKEGHGKTPPAVVLDDCIYVCGGGWGYTGRCYVDKWDLLPETAACEKFDPQIGSWESLPNMRIPRRGNALAGFEGCIYSIGGQDENSEYLASVEKLNIKTEKWIEIPPLKTARSEAAAVEVGGKIFVLGGVNAKGTLKDVECYDPQENKWTAFPEMVAPRKSFKVCVIGQKLFAVGGDGGIRPQTVEMLHLKKRKWKTIFFLSNMKIESMATIVYEC